MLASLKPAAPTERPEDPYMSTSDFEEQHYGASPLAVHMAVAMSWINYGIGALVMITSVSNSYHAAAGMIVAACAPSAGAQSRRSFADSRDWHKAPAIPLALFSAMRLACSPVLRSLRTWGSRLPNEAARPPQVVSATGGSAIAAGEIAFGSPSPRKDAEDPARTQSSVRQARGRLEHGLEVAAAAQSGRA